MRTRARVLTGENAEATAAVKQLVSRAVSRKIDHRIVARAASQSVNQSCVYSVPNFDMYRRPGVLCRSDRRASGSSEHVAAPRLSTAPLYEVTTGVLSTFAGRTRCVHNLIIGRSCERA